MKIAVIAESCDIYSGSRAALELTVALKKYTAGSVVFVAYGYKKNPEALRLLKKAQINYFLLPLAKENFFTKLFCSLKLRQLKQLADIDVISFHGSLPLYIGARLIGKPLLYTYYGTQFNALLENYFDKKNVFLHRFLNLFFNVLIYLFQAIPLWTNAHLVTISKYCVVELGHLYGRQSKFIYFGTAPPSLKNLKRIGKTQTLSLVSISRFTPYKGYHHLITLVKKFNSETNKSLQLTLVGSSPKPDYLYWLKSRNLKWLKIYEFASEIQRQKILDRTNVYLNYDRYLFLGLPIIEAAAHGIPVVTMNFCAAGEVVQHGHTGFVAGSDEEFYRYLKRLCDSAQLQRRMSQAAFVYAREKFSWKEAALKYYYACEQMRLKRLL